MAVSRDEIGLVGEAIAAFLLEHAQHRDGIGHDRGLRIGSELELVLGTLGHQLREALSKRLVDFLEDFAGGGAGGGKRGAHADRLAALPGEDESAHDWLLREGSAGVRTVGYRGQARDILRPNSVLYGEWLRQPAPRWGSTPMTAFT